MRIVILGAGQTGRGFIARLFHRRARVTFIDRDEALISALARRGSYTVRYFGETGRECISDFDCLTVDDPRVDAALTECDAIFISVRGENCAAASAWLAPRVSTRADIIVCENASLPSALLGEPLCHRAASAAVFCTCVADSETDILSENYPLLYADSTRMSAVLATLPGIAPVADFSTLMERKLYTYNAASAIIAYAGALAGYQDYAQAANDPRINALLDEFYHQINIAICENYGTAPAEQAEFAEMSRRKFQNRAILDSVSRNAASPARKLAPNERLVAPARLIESAGRSPVVSAKAIAAAIAYCGCEARETLESVSEIRPGERLYSLVMNEYQKIRKGDFFE